MLDAILNRHVVTTVGYERAIGNSVCTRKSIFTPPLVEGGENLLDTAWVLRDVDVGEFFRAFVGYFLLHLETCYTRLIISRTNPFAISKTEGLLGELVDLVLKIRAWNSFEHVVVIEPQVPGPNHGTTLSGSNDGVAVFNLILRYMKLYEFPVCRNDNTADFHNTALVSPDNLGTIGRISTTIGLRNPRVGDVLPGVVFEMTQ